MADFNVNLSAPQGAGAQALQAVETPREMPRDLSGLSDAVNIFSKLMKDKGKDAAAERKNAVIKEYVNNEKVYTDALTSGQWNAAQVGMSSRANYNKMIASYPEYMTELAEAKRSVYDGTETGEAQKQVDREIALREAAKKDAADRGFTFHPGMSEDYVNKTIDAAKYEKRVELETEKRNKQQAELRAQRSDVRSGESHEEAMLQIQRKEESRAALVAVADKNFDVLGGLVKDLVGDTKSTYEQKSFFLSQQVNRIKQGLLSVSSTNPEMAGPWQKLVEDMEMQAQKLIDPKVKSADEAKRAQDEWSAMVANAKILAITKNPHLMKYVVGSELFKDPAAITLAGSADIKEWLTGAGSGDPANKPTPILGTPNEKKTLKVLENAIGNINNGKMDPVKATQEAVNATNEIMKQTTKLDGSISPAALKDLSAFYGSAAFGQLAASGKVDMPTMQNVKQVFQVTYEPKVVSAVMGRLDEVITRSPGRDGGARNRKPDEPISATVNIVFSGNGIEFKDKTNAQHTIGSSFTRRGLDEAQAGINQLIRMGAHMEGTTNYGEYWERNKHFLMPGYYMEGVKEGTLKNGFKFLGGDARDPKNWEKQVVGK
jgi:hypothetical protein